MALKYARLQQMALRCFNQCKLFALILSVPGICPRYYTSVSYTHLDVYKRQHVEPITPRLTSSWLLFHEYCGKRVLVQKGRHVGQ